MSEESKIKFYPSQNIKEISGSENFVNNQLEKNKLIITRAVEKEVRIFELLLRELNRLGPEFFSRRIYNTLTNFRGLAFWLLFLLLFIDYFFIKSDFFSFWFPNWRPEIFVQITTKMFYLLLAVGVFTASFFTIVIETIKTKKDPTIVTGIWTNLVKYAIYPFVAAIVVGTALFLLKVGVIIPILSSLSLMFIFLTINSFYTTIKIAEKLVNENYTEE